LGVGGGQLLAAQQAGCSAIKSSGWALSSFRQASRRCSRSESLRARSTSCGCAPRADRQFLARRAQRVVHLRRARPGCFPFLLEFDLARFQALALGAQRLRFAAAPSFCAVSCCCSVAMAAC
jgi:hypothetical protein